MFNDSPWVVEESDLSFFRLIIFWGGSVSFLSPRCKGGSLFFYIYLLQITLLVFNFSAVFLLLVWPFWLVIYFLFFIIIILLSCPSGQVYGFLCILLLSKLFLKILIYFIVCYVANTLSYMWALLGARPTLGEYLIC